VKNPQTNRAKETCRRKTATRPPAPLADIQAGRTPADIQAGRTPADIQADGAPTDAIETSCHFATPRTAAFPDLGG